MHIYNLDVNTDYSWAVVVVDNIFIKASHSKMANIGYQGSRHYKALEVIVKQFMQWNYRKHRTFICSIRVNLKHARTVHTQLMQPLIQFWFENILFSVTSRVSCVSERLQQHKRGFVPANIHTTREWHHSCECDCGESGLNPYGVCVRECDSVVWSHTSAGIRFSCSDSFSNVILK